MIKITRDGFFLGGLAPPQKILGGLKPSSPPPLFLRHCYTDILVYLKRKVRLSAGWDSEGSSVSVVVGTSVTFSSLDGSVRLLGGDDIEGSLFSTTGDGADKIEKKRKTKINMDKSYN